MPIRRPDEVRDYNIKLFQKYIPDYLYTNFYCYEGDFNVQECFFDGNYEVTYEGEHARVTLIVGYNVDVIVQVNTCHLKDIKRYRYFNLSDFLNRNGKAVIFFSDYRDKSMPIFRYLLNESHLMPFYYDSRRYRMPTQLFDETEKNYPNTCWEQRFLKPHSYSNVSSLVRWIDCCTNIAVYREKEIVVPYRTLTEHGIFYKY